MSSLRAWCAFAVTLLLLVPCAGAARAEVSFVPTAPGSVHSLTPGRGFQSGTLILENRGVRPVDVTLGIEGRADDERAPESLRASFEDGEPARVLRAGERVPVRVVWSLGRPNRVREVHARVMVWQGGQALAAAGIHGELTRSPAVVADHPLAWLVLLPLLGICVLLAVQRFRPSDSRVSRAIVLGVSVLQVALWSSTVLRFDSSLGRFDGNDGYQFIERVLLGSLNLEIALGVDGISLVLLAIVPGCLLLAAGLHASERRHSATSVCSLLVDAAACAALCSTSAWLTCVAGLVLAGAGSAALSLHVRRAAVQFAVLSGAGSVLLSTAVWKMSGLLGPTFLLDGTRAARAFHMPDWAAALPLLDPLSSLNSVWLVLLLAFVCTSVAAIRVWSTAHAVPAGVGVCVSAAMLCLSAYGLMRFCVDVLPGALLWGAEGLREASVLGTLAAGIYLLLAKPLRGRLMGALSFHSAVLLLGIASHTAMGLQGALLVVIAEVLVVVVFGLTFDYFERLQGAGGSSDKTEIAAATPRMRLLVRTGLATAAGVPGSAGFIGILLILFGAFAHAALLVFAALCGWSLAASALCSAWRPPRSPEAPAPRLRESAVLVAVIVLIVVFGTAPRLLLRVSDRTLYDLAQRLNRAGPAAIAHSTVPSLKP
ncbi:MAG TPA: hypothetical protein VK524_08395 [Polyangiaceae bacterium]|nr:hypothetical protein [Polyangiaceae bacterium]